VQQVEDYEPKRSLVITPAKMLKFYEEVKLRDEIYPWQSKKFELYSVWLLMFISHLWETILLGAVQNLSRPTMSTPSHSGAPRRAALHSCTYARWLPGMDDCNDSSLS
jgi:hypothetical protein